MSGGGGFPWLSGRGLASGPVGLGIEPPPGTDDVVGKHASLTLAVYSAHTVVLRCF